MVALASNAPGQMHVLGLDRDATGMQGAQVGIFKEADEVGLTCFLEGGEGFSAKPIVVLKVILCNLSHEALKRQLADEEVGALLVAANFAKGHRARAPSVWLLLGCRDKG